MQRVPFGQPISLINYLTMSWCFGGRKFRPETLRNSFYGGHFFRKSLMTKLTLTLADSHDDENNVILCSGVNLVWNLGGRESPGQELRSRTFVRRCHEIKSPPKQILSLAEMKSPIGDSVSEQSLSHRNIISRLRYKVSPCANRPSIFGCFLYDLKRH